MNSGSFRIGSCYRQMIAIREQEISCEIPHRISAAGGFCTGGQMRKYLHPSQSKTRLAMRFAFMILATFCPLMLFGDETSQATSSKPAVTQSLIVVVGAGGTPQYEISFYQWSERWDAAAKKGGASVTIIGRHRGEFTIEGTDYNRLKEAIEKANDESTGELWIVLIGHGTFDRRSAKFNLKGPDVSADELKEWLKPLSRPVAVINCFSASGPFIPAIAGPNRIVVTATKSGTELNYSRFGDFLSRAIDDPTADLDKDNQTSLWEAFLMASRRTSEYYDTDGRLTTEHALLDDNGDGQGVRADQYRGLVAIAKSTDGHALDGRKAHQWHLVQSPAESKIPAELRVKRNELELAIENLRDHKDDYSKTEYLLKLEPLLVELAELNERLEE